MGGRSEEREGAEREREREMGKKRVAEIWFYCFVVQHILRCFNRVSAPSLLPWKTNVWQLEER
jgi:hypothetical protein